MGPATAVLTSIARPFSFRGRMGRFAFWWTSLAVYLATAAAMAWLLTPTFRVLWWWRSANQSLAEAAFAARERYEPLPFPDLVPPLATMTMPWLGFLALMVPVSMLWAAAVVRRLHDTDHVGWWYWVLLVPLLGPLLLIVLLATPTQLARNRFGPAPESVRAEIAQMAIPVKRPDPLARIRSPEAMRALRAARMDI